MILDTNALSAWADGLPSIESHLRSANSLIIPSIVLGEYYFGIRQSRYRERYEEWLRDYLPLVQVATAGHTTAQSYAEIRLELKKQGSPIPSNDTWIAAMARQHQLPLLSQDRHFDQVKDLRRIAF